MQFSCYCCCLSLLVFSFLFSARCCWLCYIVDANIFSAYQKSFTDSLFFFSFLILLLVNRARIHAQSVIKKSFASIIFIANNNNNIFFPGTFQTELKRLTSSRSRATAIGARAFMHRLCKCIEVTCAVIEFGGAQTGRKLKFVEKSCE